jgi:hypothetical protein
MGSSSYVNKPLLQALFYKAWDSPKGQAKAIQLASNTYISQIYFYLIFGSTSTIFQCNLKLKKQSTVLNQTELSQI